MIVYCTKELRRIKGKRNMTEDNVRALRGSDQSKNILEPSQARILSEVSYHCWERQFGQMDLSDPRKLKELERENNEPKKMIAEWALKNRLLKAMAKKGVLYASQKSDPRRAQTWVEFRADDVPVLVAGACHARPPLSRQQPCARRNQTRQAFSRGAALSGSHKRLALRRWQCNWKFQTLLVARCHTQIFTKRKNLEKLFN